MMPARETFKLNIYHVSPIDMRQLQRFCLFCIDDLQIQQTSQQEVTQRIHMRLLVPLVDSLPQSTSHLKRFTRQLKSSLQQI